MTELTIMIAAIVGAAAGGTMGLLMSWAAGMYGRPRRRRGSNPPPYCKPQPPSGPPQPLAADLIRYSRWRSEQIERALRDEPIRLNGSGEPTLPKLDIVPKPQPHFRRVIPGDTP